MFSVAATTVTPAPRPGPHRQSRSRGGGTSWPSQQCPDTPSRGRPSTETTSRSAVSRAAEAAGLNGDGVPKLGFHALRHTFAIPDPRGGSIRFAPPVSSVTHARASRSTSTRTSSSTRAGSTTCGIRSTPPSARAESDLDLTWRQIERARSNPSPQYPPANRLFKPFAGMERAGLEPATPSLQSYFGPGVARQRTLTNASLHAGSRR